ncbi:MAG: hypothetical protein JNJ54_06925 [Myxococcaceae bacterium]|nr:hypothetical protein [Myxococcaceae bacterium]
MPRLRIVRTPSGAAPEHVRRAWVGLELPLLGAGSWEVQSVLEQSGPRSRLDRWWRRLTGRLSHQQGFAVATLDAITVLEKERPLEAAWWRGNAGRLLVPGGVFVFDAQCGEVVE